MKVRSLKALREQRKMTQRETAQRLDITKEYLSMLERGERNPSDKLKIRLAEIYNVSINYIFLAINETNCLIKNKKEV